MNPDPKVVAALPSYEVGGEIGRGSWGVVLRGRHRQLGRDVAIKQLPPEFALDPSVRRRFVNEARLLASLDHPHIVPIYDYVELDGLCLLVMEFLTGGTVWDKFTSTGLTMETSCAVVMGACAGLEFAHARGVLHRDIKPENLMFSGNGILKVTDFGIAKVLSGTATMATRAGEVLGSPAYIAPEQATGGELGPATDVYATAVMLYELLTGRLPFPEEGDPLMVLYRHVHEDPIPVADVAPGVPQPLAEVVMRGLANQVSDRYQTAEEFGVAVAEAGSRVWGPGWLTRSEVTVMGGGPIIGAAERSAAQAVTSPAASQPGYSSPEYTGTTAQAPVAPILPRDSTHGRGASLFGTGPQELVSVGQLTAAPPKPQSRAAPMFLVAAGLAALTLLSALVGTFLGGDEPSVPPGTVSIQGADITSPDGVPIDFNRTVVVAIQQGASGDQAPTQGEVTLGFSVAGIPMGSATAPLQSTPEGLVAAVDARSMRYVVVGEVTGHLEIRRQSRAEIETDFVADTSGNPFLSLPGIGSIALFLFSLAYAESLLRSLRRGRKHFGAVLALSGVGVLLGIALAFLVWIVVGGQPSSVSLAATAFFGAGAAVATGLGAKRIGEARYPFRA